MKHLFSILLVLFPLLACAQTFSLSHYAEINASFISLQSRKSFHTDMEPKAWIGFGTGMIGGFSLNNPKHNIDIIGSYTQKRNQGNPIRLTNVIGDQMGNLSNKTITNYLSISAVYRYRFSFGLSIGSGLSVNQLIFAATKLDMPRKPVPGSISVQGVAIRRKHLNYSFRNMNFAIPLVLRYEWKRCMLFTNFESGVLSRVKKSTVKEREHTLSLGFGYFIIKEKAMGSKNHQNADSN